MKIETHLHSRVGSPCGEADADNIVEWYLDGGYDAIVVTEHYNEYLVNNFYGYSVGESPAHRYFRGYKLFKKAAEGTKLIVFLGMEMNAYSEDRPYEFMLYGFDEDFVYRNSEIYKLNQEKLYELAKKEGLLMYQTHPFREYIRLGDPDFEDGVEVFNGHPHHNSHNDTAESFAKEHNLIMMSGSDCHFKDGSLKGGIITEKDVCNEKELVKTIFDGKYKTFHV